MNQQTSIDGLFEVVEARAPRPASATSRLILVCRGGRLFGADPKGRVYMGRLQRSASRISFLHGMYQIPRKCRKMRQSVSVMYPVTGEIDPFALSQRATIRMGGRRFDIDITYLGPLPR